MDEKQKKNICNDFIKSTGLIKSDLQYPVETPDTDQTCPVTVKKVKTVVMDDKSDDFSMPEIMMECRTKGAADGYYQNISFFVSSSFLVQTFFVGIENEVGIEVLGYVNMSAKYVRFSQKELEKYYLDHRLPIGK